MKINKRSLQAAKEKMICEKTKEITIKCCFYAMLLVLNGLEGFGKTRLNGCWTSSPRRCGTIRTATARLCWRPLRIT